jgi:multiple sugar transport system ATP-binding protein
MAEIVLQEVGKRFADGTEALAPTSLTIADGELFVLVGPSGCGKSTLLKIIVGLEQPSAGRVLVGGEDVTRCDPKDRNMAMVFQSYALYPHMSVRENMAFPLRLAGMDQADIVRRVEEAAAILELGELLERKPAALSGGQRQRVAMGRAIVRQPAAFLLDEPLSNLDAKLRVQMRNELSWLQRRLGTTTVYVTHDQTEALTLGERIAVLRKGVIQQVGSPRDLYQRPANLFVAGFVGSPAMNLLPAAIDGERLILPMIELPLPHLLRGARAHGRREVIAGIRPERFREASDSDQSGGGFRASPEVIEWLGADLFVHFDVEAAAGGRLASMQRELELDTGHDGRRRLVARVGADSRAREAESMTLCIDPDGILLFDAESGERIAAGPA